MIDESGSLEGGCLGVSRGSRGVRFRELGVWGIGYRGVAGVRCRAWRCRNKGNVRT